MAAQIEGIGQIGTAASSNAVQGNNNLGKDEFLKLLIAQLANQDPTAPTDNQAFIAQLAQFSTVEQQSTMNSHLESLLVAQAANNQTSVANLVGKDILYKTDKVTLDGTNGVTLRGDLKGEATSITASITDSNGKVVRKLTVSGNDAGPIALEWDGKDENGAKLPAGEFTVKLTAVDVKGDSVEIESRGRAHSTGVTFSNGYPELIIGSAHVRLSDVVEINEPQPSTKTSNN